MKWRHHVLQLLIAACLGLALHVSSLYKGQWDWSRQGRNQLHPQTITLLKQLEKPLKITAFVPDLPLQRAEIQLLIGRYRQHHPSLTLEFIDPSQQPELARRLGIQHTPQLLLDYQGRQESIDIINEQLLTEAIARLSMENPHWIAGIQGHGEPSLHGQKNHDLGIFGQLLEKRAYKVIDLDLSSTGQIPGNVDLLILAAPENQLGVIEIAMLINHIEQGGSLLWLADGKHPQALLDYLGVAFLPGVVVDAAAADLGMDSPTIAVGRVPAKSPLHKTLSAPVLLPQVRAPEIMSGKWQAAPLLQTGARSWNETGSLKGSIGRNPQEGEQSGPLNLALALSRKNGTGQSQKVVIVGDSDFLANSFIGNGANRDFGQALIHWLTGNQQLIELPEFTATDQQLRWQPASLAWFGGVFMFALPLLLFGAGLFVIWRRRKA